MKLSRGYKILIGVLTVWPFFYFLLFFGLMVFTVLTIGVAEQHGNMPLIFPNIFWIFPLHFLTIFVMLGLMVFYIIYVLKSESLSQNQKILWILLFFFAGMLSAPVFFFLYIWKAPEV